MTVETLNLLPGEGDKKEIVCFRKECEFCGEPAHFRFTFLLPNYRRNPASKAYRHDDCSWCMDAEQYSCKNQECRRKAKVMDGHSWCSEFPAIEKFAHMFLEWEG